MADDALDKLSEADLRAEVERLRALVGPSERAYQQLRADVLGARDAAKGAELASGVLRGRIAALEVELTRARQDQARLQRLAFGGVAAVARKVDNSLRSRGR